METRFARFLSYILHPLLLPSYCLLLTFTFSSLQVQALPAKARLWLLAIVFLFTFVTPFAGILAMLGLKYVKSIRLAEPGERTAPLIFTGISYMILYYLLRNLSIPPIYLYFIYGSIIVMVAGILINLFWKVSLHTLAWGAAFGALIGISGELLINMLLPIIITIILSGFIAMARLRLRAHTPAQVYAGFALGTAIMLSLTLLF